MLSILKMFWIIYFREKLVDEKFGNGDIYIHSALMGFVEGIYSSHVYVDSRVNGPVMQNIHCFFVFRCFLTWISGIKIWGANEIRRSCDINRMVCNK